MIGIGLRGKKKNVGEAAFEREEATVQTKKHCRENKVDNSIFISSGQLFSKERDFFYYWLKEMKLNKF